MRYRDSPHRQDRYLVRFSPAGLKSKRSLSYTERCPVGNVLWHLSHIRFTLLVVTYLNAKRKRLQGALKVYVEKVGLTLKSSISTLKSVPNIRWICVNFSQVHRKARTEVWTSLTFGLWAVAAAWHVALNFEKGEDNLFNWIVTILVAFFFATGFGWHLHNLVTLHRLEKRGKLRSSSEEFGEIQL